LRITFPGYAAWVPRSRVPIISGISINSWETSQEHTLPALSLQQITGSLVWRRQNEPSADFILNCRDFCGGNQLNPICRTISGSPVVSRRLPSVGFSDEFKKSGIFSPPLRKILDFNFIGI